jgi:hypothetical protein
MHPLVDVDRLRQREIRMVTTEVSGSVVAVLTGGAG